MYGVVSLIGLKFFGLGDPELPNQNNAVFNTLQLQRDDTPALVAASGLDETTVEMDSLSPLIFAQKILYLPGFKWGVSSFESKENIRLFRHRAVFKLENNDLMMVEIVSHDGKARHMRGKNLTTGESLDGEKIVEIFQYEGFNFVEQGLNDFGLFRAPLHTKILG